MAPFFAAVDWGTTSFRSWLIGRDGSIHGESQGPDGLKSAMETGFATVLENHLGKMGAPEDLPVVMCGMVGSRQGWQEAPYVETPASLYSLNEKVQKVPYARRDVRILPGMAQRDPASPDVMRGEETQLLGACSPDGSGVFCLPGTHSKWVTVLAGRVVRFSTFMTGEIFEIVSQHSILAHSMGAEAAVDPQANDFLQGVEQSLEHPQSISNELFKLRAGQLLDLSSENAAARLSGLLIGLEIAGMAEQQSGDIQLIGAERLSALYEAALVHCGMSVARLQADRCVRQGLLTAALSIWPQEEVRKKA